VFEIGNSLREARLRQHLDFAHVEQATKIRGKYLRALEEEQFEILPSQTYIKGFLRTYAEYLGLDGQLYVDEYTSRYVVDAEEPSRPRRSAQRPRSRQQRRVESRVVFFTLAGIAAVTMLVFVAWKFGGGDTTTVLPTVTGSNVTTATPLPPAPKTAHLIVRAVRGSSLLEVHAGSSRGRPLFAGTLQRGDAPQVFNAKRIWLQASSPEALRVVLNGRTLRLRKGRPLVAVVTKDGLRTTSH
jgi:cytoskeleton protein RodZ